MEQPDGDFRQDGARPRTGEVVSGERLLTVGGPDGSEARRCPEEWMPQPRRVRSLVQARPDLGPASAVGPLAMGAGHGDLPLLDRESDIAQLLGRLAEGRSIRLVGQAGSGRSALLAAVAEAAGELAPDGVVRLSGHRRSAADLLQDLFAATHHAPDFRPDPEQLAELLARVGAVVVIDDVEPAGAELEAMLALAPECAFLISVPPGSPQLPLDSRLQDHLVAGLSRSASLTLAARLAGRPLDEIERAWAVDLWFESEGLPLRFVRAAALLRQRDVAVDALVAAREDRVGVFGSVKEVAEPADPAELEAELRRTVPLASVAESAAPAARLADGLSEEARSVLLLALALDGELPTASHLPALIDVGFGESALQELVECGLAVSVGGHHRLTEGVAEVLSTRWEPGDIAYGAAEHFSWWVGHSSVSTRQIAAEAEVLVAALHADRDAERPQAVLRLARAAAPALALSLRWGAWERVLQLGLEAARTLGATLDEAWFHHELGVYALCTGASQRSAAELEAAVALRAALGEPRGAAGARRMLDLLREDAARPVGAPTGSGGRRPVIRAIAAQVPYRFRSAYGRAGDRRRTVLAATAAVMAVGVLGTAIGLSVTGTGGAAGGGGRSGNSVEDGAGTGEVVFPSSATPSPDDPASSTAPADPSASASPSASSSTTRKPTPSKSPTPTKTTTPPGGGTGGGGTQPTTKPPTTTPTATATTTPTVTPTTPTETPTTPTETPTT
ncbi:ATP-binding protein [Kitasatospora terrestris]|uniref:AAA family ATPase n=1 Tax=Kitasatospora terrestris TaxID=258051 RepID=A0ABP9E2J5_9ACTN